MSIDGFVEKVTHDIERNCTTIELCGRQTESGYSKPGQPYLRIVRPSWTPQVGMIVWGDACEVHVSAPKGEDGYSLASGEERIYTRWGYMKLVEKGREADMKDIGFPYEEKK